MTDKIKVRAAARKLNVMLRKLNVMLRACDGTTRKATHWFSDGEWCCDWFKGGMGK